MLQIMCDKVHDRTRREKERSVKAIKRDVREEPAIPEREHEQHDQYAVQNHELRRQRERHGSNEMEISHGRVSWQTH